MCKLYIPSTILSEIFIKISCRFRSYVRKQSEGFLLFLFTV